MRASWRSAAVRKALGTAAWASALVLSGAVAAPRAVEPFDADTWARMQERLPRPAAVVFTATYCANCPAVIGRYAEALGKRGLEREVVAVVIDEASSETLLSSDHYRSASQLFAFEGDETRLRYGVDPRWRGVTPYTALLGKGDEVIFVAGMPSDEQIESWLARSR
jgi:hypothetical protein